MPEIVIGRDDEDAKKYGTDGTMFLGKHIVGSGEDAHLTSKVIIDALRPHIILLTGKRGSGKCLHGDTLITLDDGRCVAIKDLENNNNDILALDDELKIRKSSKSGFYKRIVEKILEIKLRSGRSIKLTPEHPLFTVKGWKPAETLTIGSRVATPRNLDVFDDKSLPEHKIKLLAYLIAEGHIKAHDDVELVRFTNNDDKIMEEFKGCVENNYPNLKISRYRKDTFGVIKRVAFDTKITKRGEKGQIAEYSRTVYKHLIVEWLKEIGLYGKLSIEKTIPECVFQLPKNKLAIFLNRMFSCDGSIYKTSDWEISYSSSSLKLSKQVQHLLLRFGVLSRLRKKKIKYKGKNFQSFEIVINGDNVIKFLTEIGFYGHKEERQEHALKENKKRNPNVDTIPKDIWDIYKPENWAEVGRAFDYKHPKAMRESARYSPSRQKLLLIAKTENHEGLRLLAESDIFWDEIVGIRLLEGEFEVYDITVPEYNNFVANDVIVHNSYSMGVLVEEVSKLPHHIKKNLCSVVIDTQGIFWTMKSRSERDAALLEEWGLAPKGFETTVLVPEGQVKTFTDAGVDFDGSFSIQPSELGVDDWLDVFSLEATEALGILLTMALTGMQGIYSINDIINRIKEQQFGEKEKMALTNMFLAAKRWGVFGEARMPPMLEAGKITIIDVSITPQNVRALLVGLVSKKILEERVKARRKEELSSIDLAPRQRTPMPWVFIDEAHNFLPAEGRTAATDVLNRIVKEGRQPGITLVLATQRPEKLHQDAVAQSDMVISFRLTAKTDIDALKAVMQTYLLYDISKYIAELPHLKGSAIVLDDNSERLYKIRVRPRQSWHAGSSPVAI